MDFFADFPTMERQDLRDFKKGIDLAFRNFARTYGDAIESFFEPLLMFLVWLEKLLIGSPWPIIILVMGFLAWIASRSIVLVIGTMHCLHCCMFNCRNTNGHINGSFKQSAGSNFTRLRYDANNSKFCLLNTYFNVAWNRLSAWPNSSLYLCHSTNYTSN